MRCLEDFQQFDFKHQGAERRDGCACAALAICQFLRDSQFPFRTYGIESALQSSLGSAVNREFSWLAASSGAVKRCRGRFPNCNEHERGGTAPELRLHTWLITWCGPDSVLFTPSFWRFFGVYTLAAIAQETFDDERHRRVRGFTWRGAPHQPEQPGCLPSSASAMPATSASGSSPSRPDSLSCCPTCTNTRDFGAFDGVKKLGWSSYFLS